MTLDSSFSSSPERRKQVLGAGALGDCCSEAMLRLGSVQAGHLGGRLASRANLGLAASARGTRGGRLDCVSRSQRDCGSAGPGRSGAPKAHPVRRVPQRHPEGSGCFPAPVGAGPCLFSLLREVSPWRATIRVSQTARCIAGSAHYETEIFRRCVLVRLPRGGLRWGVRSGLRGSLVLCGRETRIGRSRAHVWRKQLASGLCTIKCIDAGTR